MRADFHWLRGSSVEWKDTAAERKSASSQQRKAGAAGRKKQFGYGT
ncbi:hypothetical protein SLEP1_g41251 [Rubroshorea leprosula]|uniref:Uncharacterized protein n=1 Tax=Rubroshorea leprosula TaxID=152421 RepID=A0AAV5L623_9ROSI|nr:hypothetical protein SLEP1_g41251 [Rubroshorea leprosula]